MQEYIINFFIWFYYFKVWNYTISVKNRFIFFMTLTRALPMLSNIYKPLYGDPTVMGHIVGVFIRFWWGILGTMISIILIVPFILALIILIFLPLIPMYQTYFFLK